MKKINQGFKYRIYPDEKQREYIEGAFRVGRFVYNVTLDCEEQLYSLGVKTGKSKFDFTKHIKNLRISSPFLNAYDSLIYSYEMEFLSNSFTKFFKNVREFKKNPSKFIKNGESNKPNLGYPKYKTPKDRVKSFTTRNTGPENTKCYITEDNYLKIPKLKTPIEMVYHRPILGKLKTVTISRIGNKYYASIMTERFVEIKQREVKNVVGIDLGVKSLVVTSDNQVIENPLFLEKHLKHLKVLQINKSRCVKGSKKEKKINKQISKLHEKIANCRKHHLHNVSKQLVDKYDLISMEDLDLVEMTKSNKGTKNKPGKNVKQKSNLNRKILDSGFGMLRTMIEYKSSFSGGYTVRVDRYAPTSKKCNNCGTINNELKLSDRTWKCGNCKEKLDRDYNAALNIKDLGTKMFFDNLKK